MYLDNLVRFNVANERPLFPPPVMVHLQSFTCSVCQRVCRSPGGLQQHQNTVHREVTQEPDSDDDAEGESRRFAYKQHPKATGALLATGLYLFC